mgnify:CR=1 FL=1
MATSTSLKRAARPVSTPTRAVEHIHELIRKGELAPGDQLLPERQLAEKLGISRSSVREALAILAGMGIIEISARDGAYVKRRSPERALEPLAQILYRERESVMHMFEVRRIIETQAVRLAALRRSEPDIERLRELNERVEAEVKGGLPADESDTLFHIGILETAKNPLLSTVFAPLITPMMEVYAPARQKILETDGRRFLREHELIIQAIAEGNPDRAESLMARHIEHARRRVEEIGE